MYFRIGWFLSRILLDMIFCDFDDSTVYKLDELVLKYLQHFILQDCRDADASILNVLA